MIPLFTPTILLLPLSCWARGTSLPNEADTPASVKRFHNVAHPPSQVVEAVATSAAHITEELHQIASPDVSMDAKGRIAYPDFSFLQELVIPFNQLSKKHRSQPHDDRTDSVEAVQGREPGAQLQHRTMHSKSMLENQKMHSKSTSSRRRRRTPVPVAERARHHSPTSSVSGLGSSSESQEQPLQTGGVPEPEPETWKEHPAPASSKGILPSLMSSLGMGGFALPKVSWTNSIPASLLAAPQAVTHSMLGADSENGGGMLLCLVFVMAIALVGGAAVCMAMIDADQAQTPRYGIEDSRGSLHQHPGTSKHQQPAQQTVPPVSYQHQTIYDSDGPQAGNLATALNRPPPLRPHSIDHLQETHAAGQDSLCPALVVPDGTEFVFAVPEIITTDRQELSFNLVDLKGTALSKVVMSESRNSTQPKIILQTMLSAPLASVDTHEWHSGSREPISICRANGALFGRIQKEPSSGRYVIRHRAGRKLLTFHGDFQEKAVNVMCSITGQLVGASEKCVVDFNSASHYQVRVAPNTDAGLVICGLLAIDKLEGTRSTLPSTRSPLGGQH